MTTFFFGLALVLAAGAAAAAAPARLRPALLVGLTSGGFALTLPALAAALSGSPPAEALLALPAPLPALRFGLDALSALFALLMAAVSCAATLHAVGYLNLGSAHARGPLGSHLVLLSVLLASMPLVVAARSALALLFAWELMALSSFLLILFEHEEAAVRRAAVRYLAFGHLGAFCLVAGFALAAGSARSDAFGPMLAALAAGDETAGAAALLLFAGFAMKAGLVPFHGWLPEAHPAAPSHVSALMSGVMIKTGVYGLLRFAVPAAGASVPAALALLSLATLSALGGVLYAIVQHDMKRLLAYHSVENIGIIGMGVGAGCLGLSLGAAPVAVLGFAGALFHTVNHALFKSLLFLSAGNVIQAAGTRDIESLGGLARRMPRTALAFLSGSVAISGLPPFNGFASEFLVFLALLSALHLPAAPAAAGAAMAVAALAAVGALALLCFTKVFGIAFLGEPRGDGAARAAESSRPQTVACLALAALCLALGLAPGLIHPLLSPALAALSPSLAGAGPLSVFLKLAGLATTGTAALLCALLAARALLTRRDRPRAAATWGCGYLAPTPRMQYTASSFAGPLLSLAGPPLGRRVVIERPAGLFPVSGACHSTCEDRVERHAERPLVSFVERACATLARVQTGDLRLYVLYGLVFLALALGLAFGGTR